MKKWKWFLGGMICCICCMLYVFPAKADVIWEPEDSFYQKHASDCTYVNRVFTANGPDNVVLVYQSPELPIVVERWENGNTEWISFTYKDSDGIVWGYCRGWMPMEYMEVVYDSISFAEEYADQITKDPGELGNEYLGKEIYCWGYPGAENGYTMTLGSDYTPSYSGVFTDEEGNIWGSVGYYFGRKNFWICIDKPEVDYEQLYPNGGPQRGSSDKAQGTVTAQESNRSGDEERLAPAGEGADAGSTSSGNGNRAARIVPKMNGRTVAAAVGMVALVVAATAALLTGLRKGRKNITFQKKSVSPPSE